MAGGIGYAAAGSEKAFSWCTNITSGRPALKCWNGMGRHHHSAGMKTGKQQYSVFLDIWVLGANSKNVWFVKQLCGQVSHT